MRQKGKVKLNFKKDYLKNVYIMGIIGLDDMYFIRLGKNFLFFSFL